MDVFLELSERINMPIVPVTAREKIQSFLNKYNAENTNPKLVLFDSQGTLLVENYLPYVKLDR